MLARHADNLFWAGRYLARAEDTARMLDVTYHGSLPLASVVARNRWRTLLATLRLQAIYDATGLPTDGPRVTEFLVHDEDNPGSIVNAVGRLRENLGALRDFVPSELWECANRFHLELRARDIPHDLAGAPYALLGFVKLRCQTLAGITSEAMARDDGYHFMMVGWNLERAVATCRLLEARYAVLEAGSFDEVALTLRSVSGFEAYQRARRTSVDVLDLAAFLLQSTTFPRSVLFCLRFAEAELSRVEGTGRAVTRPQRLLGQLRSRLEFADVSELAADMHSVLAELENGIRHAAEATALQFFRGSKEFSLNVQYLLPGEVGR